MTRGDMATNDTNRRRAGALLGLTGLVLAALGARVLHINTALRPRLLAVAAAQQKSETEVPARRGSILDAKGRLLAGSGSRYSVYADPGLIERPDEVASALAPVLDMEAGELENEIRTSSAPRFCWLRRLVDDAQASAVRALHLPGVGLESEFQRRWPMHETAAHVLGFTGRDGRGLEGLELKYEAHLRGRPGQRSTLRDARRRPLGAGDDGFVPPEDGGHIVLTIDSVIQQMVETRLAEQVDLHGAECGIAIVMSPRTGAILALACVPTYDPARYNNVSPDVWRDRALTDPIEPGSTFKPFIMAGALEGGYVSTTEKIDCHNGLCMFGSRRVHDSHPHGLLDARDILVYSSNIGMGIIGTRMGNDALYEIITRFGFGRLTQIDLPGESPGLVMPLESWTSYSTTSVSFGQEIAVTPIQLVTAFSAIVNGGILLRPRVTGALLAADGEVIESHQGPDIIRRVLNEDLARYLTEDVLTGVVERGGKELDVRPYTMAGKTGTAQVPYENRRGYEPNAYQSSFVCAAPIPNPQITVLVTLRKPDPAHGHYGRVVAGPAARDIVRSTLQYLQVPPTNTGDSRSDHR